MTEYDYSEEAQLRWIATQNRISRWVNTTPRSPSQFKNPFKPRSNASSEASRSSSHSHSHNPSGSRAPSGGRSYLSPPNGSYTVYPSHSISQAPLPPPSSHRRSHGHASSAHRSLHSSRHSSSHRAPTMYIVQPPPPTHQGMIIFPRRGHSPSVIYY